MAGNFNGNTLRRIAAMDTKTAPTAGGLVTWQLPKTGFMARLWVIITGSVGGTVNGANALGFSSVVQNLNVNVNGGQKLVDLSGPGYHWLYRNYQGLYFDPVNGASGRTAVTATTFDVSMLLNFQLNENDPLGLFNLQNDQTTVQLSINFETPTNVGGSTATTPGTTITPYLEYFSLPSDPADFPPDSFVTQIIEDKQTVAAAGDFTYSPQRGSKYLQLLHGFGFGVSGSDAWSAAKLRIGTDPIQTIVPTLANYIHALTHPAVRLAGVIPFDFMGSTGLGTFGSPRDWIDTSKLSDFSTIVTTTGSGTLYTVRRLLTPVV